MPRYDGPYVITDTVPDISTVTIDLPNNPQMFPTFHTLQVLPFVENDPSLFPSHELSKPPPIIIDSEQEFFIERILDKRKCGRGVQYLVRWHGYGPEDDHWLPGHELDDCEALDTWLARKDSVTPS